MKKLLLCFVAVFALSFAASAADYSINDNLIDMAIESAVEVSADYSMPSMPSMPALPAVSQKNDGVALALTFLLGGLGIHRHYMGTSRWMWAAYFFTFGGIFGIVPLVDLIVEVVALVDGTGLGQYYNNPKFFMWM